MNFPGKINNLTLLVINSSPQQFHTVNAQCTKQNQKMSSKKNRLRESVVIHIVACKQTLLAMSGFNRRKWEEKGEKESRI